MRAKDLVAQVVSSAVCLNEFHHCGIRAKSSAFEDRPSFYSGIFPAFFAPVLQRLRLVQQKAVAPPYAAGFFLTTVALISKANTTPRPQILTQAVFRVYFFGDVVLQF